MSEDLNSLDSYLSAPFLIDPYLEERIAVFRAKITKKTYREEYSKKLKEFIINSEIYNDRPLALIGLNLFSEFILFPVSPSEVIIKELKATINHIKHYEPTFGDDYARNMDFLLGETEQFFPFSYEDTSGILLRFKEVADDCLGPYNGENLRISDKIEKHGTSLLITPREEASAVSLLANDRPRHVFSKYDAAESTEAYVAEYYGTDGKFANHYTAFISDIKRYSL